MNYSDLKQIFHNNPELARLNPDVAKEFTEEKGIILKPISKIGWRDDLNKFFRSSWEANIARYLNFIKEPWAYEDKEWGFPVKRGNRFYKCDFHLLRTDEFWEVKGYMDKKSQTKLNRMAKYYPEIKIKIIGKEEYREIAKFKDLIPGWEGVSEV